jgi:hypothetical protein
MRCITFLYFLGSPAEFMGINPLNQQGLWVKTTSERFEKPKRVSIYLDPPSTATN